MNADERETVVNATDADEVIRVWTAQPRFINKLRKHPSFTETKSGRVDGSEWAEFTIPAYEWNPVTGAKRRSGLTTEQRQAAGERMRALQKTQKGALSGDSPTSRTGQRDELDQTHTIPA